MICKLKRIEKEEYFRYPPSGKYKLGTIVYHVSEECPSKFNWCMRENGWTPYECCLFTKGIDLEQMEVTCIMEKGIPEPNS